MAIGFTMNNRNLIKIELIKRKTSIHQISPLLMLLIKSVQYFSGLSIHFHSKNESWKLIFSIQIQFCFYCWRFHFPFHYFMYDPKFLLWTTHSNIPPLLFTCSLAQKSLLMLKISLCAPGKFIKAELNQFFSLNALSKLWNVDRKNFLISKGVYERYYMFLTFLENKIVLRYIKECMASLQWI